jgi:hypothetical protein
MFLPAWGSCVISSERGRCIKLHFAHSWQEGSRLMKPCPSACYTVDAISCNLAARVMLPHAVLLAAGTY